MEKPICPKMADAEWRIMSQQCSSEPKSVGRRPHNDRELLDTAFQVTSLGKPWREAESETEKWDTVYRRYKDWSRSGAWWATLSALVRESGYSEVIKTGDDVWGLLYWEGVKSSTKPQACPYVDYHSLIARILFTYSRSIKSEWAGEPAYAIVARHDRTGKRFRAAIYSPAALAEHRTYHKPLRHDASLMVGGPATASFKRPVVPGWISSRRAAQRSV